MRTTLLILLLGFLFSQGMAQEFNAQSKNGNTYTHSIGLNSSLDLRMWSMEKRPWSFGLDFGVDLMFSFSQNGVGQGWQRKKTLSPLWNLIPYYELGVNNKVFFKLEHFCTYRDVLKDTDPHSRNHSIYVHIRKNVFHKRNDPTHKLLLGGKFGTEIYREKRIDETDYKVGLAPLLLVGASAGYYYNFTGKFDVYCSLDNAMAFAETEWKNNFNFAYSLLRVSFGVQYTF